MPGVNLLPWREWRRRERRRRFLMLLALGVTAGIVIVFWADRGCSYALARQEIRNDYLKSESARLDRTLAAVSGLKQMRSTLMARMQAIERLERSRPAVVHVFDQLARTIPGDVWLTAVNAAGDRLRISGVARSPAAVSVYLHRLAASPWFGDSALEVVRGAADGDGNLSSFSVTTVIRNSGDPQADGP